MSVAPTFYAALSVAPNASLSQIRRAYRRLALKYHPDTNADGLPTEQCEVLLRQLSNALEALSDKRLRTLYDKRGPAGLDGHTFKDARRVFDEFFGTANPFEALLPSPGDGPGPAAQALADFAAAPAGRSGAKTSSSSRSSFRRSNTASNNTSSAVAAATSPGASATAAAPASPASSASGRGFTKGRTAVASLPLTLEEMYSGCQRRISIKRKRVRPGGAGVTRETRFLNVHVPPGTPAGTEIHFADVGDEEPGCLPSDVVFRVEERPHPRYRRVGNDLVCQQRVTLLQALTQCVVQVTTLDGRVLSVACHAILTPKSRKVLPNEGMPIPGTATSASTSSPSLGPGFGVGFRGSGGGSSNSSSSHGAVGGVGSGAAVTLGTMLPALRHAPRARGDLVIEFDIEFPSHLSQEQKMLLQQALRPGQR